MNEEEILKVLLTGFGPFPGVPENLSGAFVAELADRAVQHYPQAYFHCETLSTEWSAPAKIAQLIGCMQPNVCLHFGVSETAKGFVLETRAENTCRFAQDACGNLPYNNQLESTGPQFRSCKFPIKAAITKLRSLEFPVQSSYDAGGYLCNAVLYESLRISDLDNDARIVGFVHLPTELSKDLFNGSSLSHANAIQGGLALIDICLKELSDRPPK